MTSPQTLPSQPDPPAPWSTSTVPTATEPVERPIRRRSMRWAIAAAATAVVVVAAGAVAMFATGGQTTRALGPTLFPASTVAYVEARLDLPGDQRDQLVRFVGRFPGFADPASFELKVNDVLDRLTGDGTGGRITYTRDIKPWFEGEFAIGLTEIPSGGELDPADVPVIGALSVSDRTSLETFLAGLRGDAQAQGATITESAHGAATIVTVSGTGTSIESLSYAVTDDALIFAFSADKVGLALDVKSGTQPSLEKAEAFKSQFEKLPAERLGALYFDFSVIASQLDDLTGIPGMAMPAFDPATLPKSIVAAVRTEGDRVALEMRLVPGAATALASTRSSTLASRMAASTIAYLEIRDFGTSVGAVFEQLKTMGVLTDEQATQAEALLGTPLEDYLDFAQDAAIGVDYQDGKIGVGLAATVTDPAVAADRLGRLVSALRTAAAFGALPIEVTEEQVGGVAVTTIKPVAGEQGMGVPSDLPIDVSVSHALHDGTVLLGTGDFVRDAIERPAAEALGATAGYTAALEAAGGATNQGVVFVDIGRLREVIENFIPADERAHYETDQKPYVAPFDRLVSVATQADGVSVVRVLLFVE